MTKKQPLILVTNDDGITAKGIKSLVEAVAPFGEVVIVAPDKPQSGMGHAITVNNPLRLSKSVLFDDFEAYTCSGTPVDCVKLAIYEILNRKPDLLVSGINHGENSSTNVLYSGTMSAAVEGAMERIPSVGFSLLDFDSDANFKTSQYVVKKVVQQVLSNKYPEGICLNVNIPKCDMDELKGIRV
ncbi:MAG: 5'/3'-nucleotidase SurE, partial [Lishizhenia sp.]